MAKDRHGRPIGVGSRVLVSLPCRVLNVEGDTLHLRTPLGFRLQAGCGDDNGVELLDDEEPKPPEPPPVPPGPPNIDP